MADSTEIKAWNNRAWTGVTQTFQAHSEEVQDARGTVQEAYDAAQGNGATARDSALLAAIESEAAQRQNRQQGVHIVPEVPTTP